LVEKGLVAVVFLMLHRSGRSFASPEERLRSG
jgi:hypothetical protein